MMVNHVSVNVKSSFPSSYMMLQVVFFLLIFKLLHVTLFMSTLELTFVRLFYYVIFCYAYNSEICMKHIIQ